MHKLIPLLPQITVQTQSKDLDPKPESGTCDPYKDLDPPSLNLVHVILRLAALNMYNFAQFKVRSWGGGNL